MLSEVIENPFEGLEQVELERMGEVLIDDDKTQLEKTLSLMVWRAAIQVFYDKQRQASTSAALTPSLLLEQLSLEKFEQVYAHYLINGKNTKNSQAQIDIANYFFLLSQCSDYDVSSIFNASCHVIEQHKGYVRCFTDVLEVVMDSKKFVMQDGCFIVPNPVTVDELNAVFRFAQSFDAEQLFADAQLSRWLEATIVFGTPANLSRLRKRLNSLNHEKGIATTLGASAQFLTPDEIQWLARGERGASSEVIFYHTLGVAPDGFISKHFAPMDLSDFRRCRLLLEQCPRVAKRFHQAMSQISGWQGLVRHWDELCQSMDSEHPAWREQWQDSLDKLLKTNALFIAAIAD